MFLCVECPYPPTSRNGTSTRNFLISNLDFRSASKFTLECYNFISILQNYSRKFEKKMASFFSKATQPIRMHLTIKMLPPFGEEGCSANENAGFLVITKIICNRSNENAGCPDTTKLHVQEDCPANEHVGFAVTTKPRVAKARHNADEALLFLLFGIPFVECILQLNCERKGKI